MHRTDPDFTAAIPDSAWRWPLGREHPAPSRNKAPTYSLVGDDGPWGGVPLGGFGSGTIGRTPRGDFARWHLRVGWHTFRPLPACMFSVRFQVEGEAPITQALWTGAPEDGRLGSWQWNYPVGAGSYGALYPKAWFSYEHPAWPLRLTQEMFSPVLPHNYRETSYPVGCLSWLAENRGERPMAVSLLFTWQHPVAPDWQRDGRVRCHNRVYREESRLGPMAGVVLRNHVGPIQEDWQGSFAIGVLGGAGLALSTQSRFDVTGDGSDLWEHFAGRGELVDTGEAAEGEAIGAAVAASFTLAPGEQRPVHFVLAWDFPLMAFGASQGQEQMDNFFVERKEGRRCAIWYRRYTSFWGREGEAAWQIAREGLEEREAWGATIDRWHGSVPATRPAWYRCALFNELYYLADGGTAWEAGRPGEAADEEIGRFAYLECFDYPFYSTLDVRFYASWALALNWPALERQVMRQFIPTIDQEELTPYIAAGSQTEAVRKLAGALPHDLGAPFDAPWERPNAYTYQDVNIWKDLNSKYVLLILRDVLLTDDLALAEEAWPTVEQALAYLQRFDRDGDCLPENDALPDQTYDNWPMKGVSAYCGGLWLAALLAAARLAELLGRREAADQYRALFEQAQPRFERLLWNGRYYRYDTEGEHREAIMADQLCGQWYARACGLPNIVASDRAMRALLTIFEYNVIRFGDGQLGAVNGMLPDGRIDESNEQSEEVWTGTTYALAALMLQEGLDEAAWKTAWGIYHTTYRSKGLWFRTPEAWNQKGDHRAALYMRPQAIWAMEHALRVREAGESAPQPYLD